MATPSHATGSSMRFGDLTYLEIRERAKEGWLAIVPTGCTEQQGPHLPVDSDTWLAETVTLAASERAAHNHGVRSLVLPAVPFGPTPEHRGYGGGYVDVPVEVHKVLIRAVLDSLAEQGFRRIVVWRGCGGHYLNEVVDRFNDEHAEAARAFLPSQPYQEIWCRLGDPSVPGGHADSFTTSIALHLRPWAVRADRIFDPQHEVVGWEESDLSFAKYSSTGVIGDPTHASAELGALLWPEVVEAVALTLKPAAEAPVDERGAGRQAL